MSETEFSFDPDFMLRRAWQLRWSHPKKSKSLAKHVLNRIGRSDLQDCRYAAHCYLTLAWHEKWSGKFPVANAHLQLCEELFKIVGEKRFLPLISSMRAIIAFEQNDFGCTELFIQDGAASLSHDSADEALIDLLSTQAAFQRVTGKFDDAELTLIKARHQAKGHDLARIHMNLACYGHAAGDTETTHKFGVMSLVQSRHFANKAVLPYANHIFAVALTAKGNWKTASEVIEDGLIAAKEIGDIRAKSYLDFAKINLMEKFGDVISVNTFRETTETSAKMRGFDWLLKSSTYRSIRPA